MNCNNDKKIMKKAIQKIEFDQQFKSNYSCPIGPTGPEKLKEAYLVTFNDGTYPDGLPINSEARIPINRKETDIHDIITLDSDNNTIKFNLIGYYKINFIVNATVLKTNDVFDSKNDFISIGFKLLNTDNIYIGSSNWIYNEEYNQLTAQGILAVDNINNIYELINISPKTIYLNTPNLNHIKSISYFTNSLVNIIVEYLGK